MKGIVLNSEEISYLLENPEKSIKKINIIKFELNNVWRMGFPVQLLGDWTLSSINRIEQDKLHYDYQVAADDYEKGITIHPYGEIDTILYVKEAFTDAWVGSHILGSHEDYVYRADKGKYNIDWETIKWNPSTWMTEEKSRIKMEVKDFCVKRILETSNIYSKKTEEIWKMNPWVWETELKLKSIRKRGEFYR